MGEAGVGLLSPYFSPSLSLSFCPISVSPLLPYHYFFALYFPCQSLSVFHSLPRHCLTVCEDGGGEAERRSVGIITVWRTRMDLYAISVVGCCANLPSTNGTAVHCRSTSWYQSKVLNKQNRPFGNSCLAVIFSVAPSQQSIHAYNKHISREIKTNKKKNITLENGDG